MATTKDLSALVARYEAKAIAKPSKAALLEAKLDAKIASLIAKGKTVVIDGATVTSYNLDTGSSSGGSSSGGGSTSTTGSTFTLSTGADGPTPTSGNDTFNGAVSYTDGGATSSIDTTSTFTVADALSGGAGTDRLNVTISGVLDGGTLTLAAADLSSIEEIYVRNVATPDAAGTDLIGVNAGLYTGVTNVGADRSTNSVIVTNLASGAAATINGNEAIANAALTFGYATATSAATLNVTGGTRDDDDSTVVNDNDLDAIVNLTGSATSITINSSGAANTLDSIDLDSDAGGATVTSVTISATTGLTVTNGISNIAAATAATITISGAGAVSLGTIDSDVDTITAGSGGLTATVGSNNTAVVGGAGNDVITVAEGVVYSSKTIAAGDGSGDVIGVTDDTAWTSSTVAKYTGFEIVRILDDADTDVDTFDLSLLSGIGAIQIRSHAAGTDDLTLTKVSATQAAAITVQGDLAGDLTIGVDNATNPGTTDAVILTLDNSTASADVDIAGALGVAGVETLTIVSTDAGSNVNSIASISTGSTALRTITITGAEDISLTVANDLNIETINASAATGIVTIDASAETASGVAITGGSGNDVLTGGAGTDVLTLGAGDDSVVGGAGADTISGGDGNDSISGGDGADSITLGAGTDTYEHDAADDSTTGNVVTGVTNISGSVDVITGAGNGDKFNFALTTALGAAISDETLSSSLITLANGTDSNINIVRGTYNSSTGIFTLGTSSSDDDYMIQVQDAEGGGADTLHSVVLVGISGTVTFDATTAGLVTLQVA